MYRPNALNPLRTLGVALTWAADLAYGAGNALNVLAVKALDR